MTSASTSTGKPEDLIVRLRKRAEIRRQIKDRKSVQEGRPDRIADLLDEAADHIEKIEFDLMLWKDIGTRFTRTPGK